MYPFDVYYMKKQPGRGPFSGSGKCVIRLRGRMQAGYGAGTQDGDCFFLKSNGVASRWRLIKLA